MAESWPSLGSQILQPPANLANPVPQWSYTSIAPVIDQFKLEVGKKILSLSPAGYADLARRILTPLQASSFSTSPQRYGTSVSHVSGAWIDLAARGDNGESATDGRVHIGRNIETVQQK